jgi:hypothetical protein
MRKPKRLQTEPTDDSVPGDCLPEAVQEVLRAGQHDPAAQHSAPTIDPHLTSKRLARLRCEFTG